MSNAFTNFLGSVASGIFDSGADLKDYQHADRLFVKDTYARAPKLGFLYYVIFDVNQDAIKAKSPWLERGKPNVGLLVKKIDLPKFNIQLETINQYNKKALYQTGIKYSPITIDFHDDNSNITTNLWKNYYQYYYADGNYTTNSPAFSRGAKDGITDYAYGLDSTLNNVNKLYRPEPFFKKIDIFVLHQKKYTQYTLVNPMVSEWSHDQVGSDEGNKILANKMTVSYESVIYNTEQSNVITKNSKPENFAATHYDKTPSPLSVGGKGSNTLFGPNGVISGADNVLGAFANAKSPLDFLGAGIQAVQLGKQVSQLSKAGLRQEGYSILGGVLGQVQQTGNQPGGLRDQLNNAITNKAWQPLANTGVTLFENQTVNNTTYGNLKKLGPGGG